MEPVAMPSMDALPVSFTSCSIHVNAAVAAASRVQGQTYNAERSQKNDDEDQIIATSFTSSVA